MNKKKTILGFIAGVSVGAIVGILLSPEKGSTTRQKIADRTTDLGVSLKDSLLGFVKGKKSSTTNGAERGNEPMNLNTMG